MLPSRRWIPRSKLGKLVLAVFGALVVLELLLRIFDPFSFAESRRRDAITAKIMGHNERWLSLQPGGRAVYCGHEIVIGSHGLRNPPTPLAKPKGTYRILVLGDSVAFGWGVAAADAFPRVLERQLREDPPPKGYERIEVINASVPGRNLVNNYLYLKERGLQYEPDLILLTLVNDDVPRIDESGKEIAKRRGILLPRWTRVLDLGFLLQLTLDRIFDVEEIPGYEAGQGPPKGGLMHACALFQLFKEASGDIPLAIIDTYGKKGGKGLPEIIACCKRLGLPRIPAFLWSKKYREEYAVSAVDDHPNAQGHLDMARPVVKWCRDNLPK